jgi:monovalent cation:H+ antiporter-2, CPA2 family
LALIATVVIIVVVKSAAAYAIVRAFGRPQDVALTIAASLAQIGEFSFILIVMGVSLGIVPEQARDLVVAGAMISILVNPVLFGVMARINAGKVVPE